MRVLLLGDTHGALDARVLALAGSCELAVHAGDVGNAAVLSALREACGEVHAVRGNNDVAAKWPAADRAALALLPTALRIQLPGGVLAVEHGDRFPAGTRHARLREAHGEAKAVLYGHSHRLLVDDDASPWILNAGAAGRARTHGGPSCLVLSASVRRWRVQARQFPITSR
jgi:putative phosphoesterase